MEKANNKTDIIENTGKVLINLGQLMFGTLFLGSVLRGEAPQYLIMITGITGAAVLIVVGLIASAKKK